MKVLDLNAEIRTELRKNSNRALRRSDLIPAILYGSEKNIPLKINSKDFSTIHKTLKHHNIMINLKIKDGNKEDNKESIIKEIQIDPVSRNILHIDFFEITKGKKIIAKVPLEFVGSALGVKEGGIAEHVLREIEVECLPKDMPDSLEIDISNLNIGDTYKISDISLSEEIRILDNPNQNVASIIAPSKYEEPVAEEEAEIVEGEEVEGEEKAEEKGEEKADKKEDKKEQS